ncbi:unnamed protein product [Xylocopa violacea]|uniref:Ubiquitin-like protease family profile domain-containing protein n=1 Tax=Xylocopa violacea TaxID=135666 RepID=A0ABP1P4E3_XYLVO
MANDPLNEIVLSYYNYLLRARDVALLQGSHWLNDVIIGFYFEYLDETFNKDGQKLLYYFSPELTQLLKITELSRYDMFFDPTIMSKCECVFFPLNNCDKKDAAGGSHWSLLVYSKQDKTCYHFDSSKGYNNSTASKFAENLMSYFLDKGEPNKKFVEVDCPQQDNSYDCGVYVLCLTDVITEHVIKTGGIGGCDYGQVKKLTYSKRTKLLHLIYDLKHTSVNK